MIARIEYLRRFKIVTIKTLWIEQAYLFLTFQIPKSIRKKEIISTNEKYPITFCMLQPYITSMTSTTVLR